MKFPPLPLFYDQPIKKIDFFHYPRVSTGALPLTKKPVDSGYEIALNKEVTRLIGQKPVDAIKKKTVPSKPSTPYLRAVGVNEKKLPSGLSVRYLYQPGELEGGRRRATDPIWSLNVYEIEKIMIKPDAPVIYYLFDGPKRWFVREELLVVPPDTQLPPAS